MFYWLPITRSHFVFRLVGQHGNSVLPSLQMETHKIGMDEIDISGTHPAVPTSEVRTSIGITLLLLSIAGFDS